MRRTWRLILGWFLAVLGVLVVLFGVIAIAGSYIPGTEDPGSARAGGAIFIAFGLLLAAPGAVVLIRSRRRGQPTPAQPRPPRKLTKAHLVGSAASGLLVAGLGIAAIVYSNSLDDAVQRFHSAHKCTSRADANCYQLRDVVITGVDVSHGNEGEIDTVHFVDAGSPQVVTIHPGDRDSSVLRTGADGVATLWEGKYTNLQIAGVSFATIDNPVGQQGEWRLLGDIGVGFGLLNLGGVVAIFRYLGKSSAAKVPRQGSLLGTRELLPSSAVGMSGYPILPLMLHPKPLGSALWLWLLALPLEVWLVLGYLPHSGRVVQWTVGGGVALVTLASFVWALVFRPRSGIFVDEMSFGMIGGFGRRRSWARNEASRVVVKNVDRARRTAAFVLALVVGPDGRAVMRFPADFYDKESLRQLAAALRVPLDSGADEALVTRADLEKEIPGALPWSMRHGTAVGGGMAIVAVAVIAVVMLLIGVGPSHR
jgi:hypothetical protein